MFAKFFPMGDFVLVKLLPKVEVTVGGLYVPESTPTNIQFATVICPSNCYNLKIHDRIAFIRYQGHALDDQYMVIKTEFILGVCHD